MDEQEKTKEFGLVKGYLKFVDTNVLFKKPVSCLFAICSLLIPLYFLIQIIQFRIFELSFELLDVSIIVVSMVLLWVSLFAGLFGSMIWWNRRIVRDEGPKWYPNFRRFIQTLGEWLATVYTIIAFTVGIVLIFVSNMGDFSVLYFLPGFILNFGMMLAPISLITGFLIIIATKIILFLLDPFIWLIKQIWGLLVRLVLYFYRVILKVFGVYEQNAPVWSGVNWLIAIMVVISGIIMGIVLWSRPSLPLALGTIFAMALGLGYMGFIVNRRKNEA